MLTVKAHGPVTELRLTATLLRRPLYSVSAYLFDGALIDTGPPRTGPELAAWVQGQPVSQIINTHRHEDHVGGNPCLPHLPARAPAGAVEWMRAAPRIPFYRRFVFGQPRPAAAEALGETAGTQTHRLHVIPTPGHAPDHVVLWLPQRGWLFGGDLFIMERAKYVRAQDDVTQWLASLRHVLNYDFDTLYCAHAGVIRDAKAAIRRKIGYWEEIHEKARELAAQEYPLPRIRDYLLGGEGYLTYWSRGRFSKLNLVRALLDMPVDEAPPAVHSLL